MDVVIDAFWLHSSGHASIRAKMMEEPMFSRSFCGFLPPFAVQSLPCFDKMGRFCIGNTHKESADHVSVVREVQITRYHIFFSSKRINKSACAFYS